MIEIGNVFSELSQYKVTGIHSGVANCYHFGTGETVAITTEYLEKMCTSGVHYEGDEEVTFTELKRIFEEIPAYTPFTVVFRKKDKAKTKKAYQAELLERVQKAVEEVEKARRNKESMVKAAAAVLEDAHKNPVLDHTPGEMRQLTGWKIDRYAGDGFYKVQDAYVDPAKNERLVNVNEIYEVVFNKKRYLRK